MEQKRPEGELPFRTIEEFCYTHNIATLWDMVDYVPSVEGDVRLYKCRDCTQRKYIRLDSEMNYEDKQREFARRLEDA